MSLESQILYIQSSVDEKFRLILNKNWNSLLPSHRQDIRNCLAHEFSSHFSRLQLAQLCDLSLRPQASDGHFSISHCPKLGGFAYSQFKIGFDVEELRRISIQILKRTALEPEFSACPKPEFLWGAKEAGYKALSGDDSSLVISDLTTYDWQSHNENQLFSFRLKAEKTLDFALNRGFIFSDAECLFAIFLK